MLSFMTLVIQPRLRQARPHVGRQVHVARHNVDSDCAAGHGGWAVRIMQAAPPGAGAGSEEAVAGPVVSTHARGWRASGGGAHQDNGYSRKEDVLASLSGGYQERSDHVLPP